MQTNVVTVPGAALPTAVITGSVILPFLFVLVVQPFLPVGPGLAAGAKIWMVFAELIPDALQRASGTTVGTTATLAFAAMITVQNVIIAV